MNLIETQIRDLLAVNHLPQYTSIMPVTGGKNNKVYLLKLEDDSEVISKFYYHSENDHRDRFFNETFFLSFAKDRNLSVVPQLIASDAKNKISILSKLPGKKIETQQITLDHINQAVDFIVSLNRDLKIKDKFVKASEACFSINEHLSTVDRRIKGLTSVAGEEAGIIKMKSFIEKKIIPTWLATKSGLEKSEFFKDNNNHNQVPESESIISPSDFGFHNILIHEDKLRFLDFEYAGLDDCAKLICDFFCAPEIPAPMSGWISFVETVGRQLGLGENFSRRVNGLLPVYKIKWICIVLNEFINHDDSRRSFSLNEDSNLRRTIQLDKAEAMFEKLTEH